MRGSSDPPPGSATPGRERDQRNKIAAIERQGLDLGLIDAEVHRRVGGLEQGRGGGHVDRLRGLADFEPHIEGGLIAQAQDYARLAVNAKSRLLDAYDVARWRQSEDMIFAALVGLVVYCAAVAWSSAVTFALGTESPVGSSTVPNNSARPAWPKQESAETKKRKPSERIGLRCLLNATMTFILQYRADEIPACDPAPPVNLAWSLRIRYSPRGRGPSMG